MAESYNKRIEHIHEKLLAKRNCAIDSFEVKELIGEYGFVMKQLTQAKDEKGIMLAVADSFREGFYKEKLDAKYGEGAADFLVQAIETFYKS